MLKKYATIKLDGWVCVGYVNTVTRFDFLVCRGGARKITRERGLLIPYETLNKCEAKLFMKAGLPERAARILEAWCIEERPNLLKSILETPPI